MKLVLQKRNSSYYFNTNTNITTWHSSAYNCWLQLWNQAETCSYHYNCALLGCYTGSNVNILPSFRYKCQNCPESSVRNCHCSVRNNPEESNLFWYISNKMQRYTIYLFLETALHASGGISNHHQEHIQLYLQHLAQVPDAVDTVVCAPDDGWRYHAKHVEQFPEINKLCNVASCWICIRIYSRCTTPEHKRGQFSSTSWREPEKTHVADMFVKKVTYLTTVRVPRILSFKCFHKTRQSSRVSTLFCQCLKHNAVRRHHDKTIGS